MSTELDDDPFDGYGLPEEAAEGATASDAEAGSERQEVAPMPARAKEEQRRYELPPPAAFEVQPRRGAVRCEECYHYVDGGALTIDRIYEAGTASLFDLIRECKEFEKSFEVRELKEIAEKAKTLDETFDAKPRVRGYCAAGRVDSDSLYLIAEIRNHDGKCADFLPGRPPIVSCHDCAHRKPASQQPPSLADYSVDFGDSSIGLDYDVPGYVNALRSQYDRQDQYYRRDEEQYNESLQNDIRDVVFNDRSPDNFTLDYCNKDRYGRACAAVNKSLRCTEFRSPEEQRFEDMQRSVMEGPFKDFVLPLPQNFGFPLPQKKDDAPVDRQGKNHRKWFDLSFRNAAYSAETDRVRKAKLDRILEIKTPPLTEEQKRIPCFDCVHRRDPVNVDPFATVHFNNPEIMNVRDQYRLEKAGRKNEERRLCAVPGPFLGDAEVPSQHIWCDLHSRRQDDGKAQEYAYCYRVLKAKAPNGECPGFRSKSAPAPPLQEEPSASTPDEVEQPASTPAEVPWDWKSDRIERNLRRALARNKKAE